jgi:mannan endo-1,6-alpha-mannosidase
LGTAEKPDIVKRLHMRCISVTLTLALAAAYQIEATSISVCSNSAISSTAGTLADTMMSYYDPANVGLLPAPYFWWEAGGMWGIILDCWHCTGDAQYNSYVAQAIMSQAGSRDDFMGPYTQVRVQLFSFD